MTDGATLLSATFPVSRWHSRFPTDAARPQAVRPGVGL